MLMKTAYDEMLDQALALPAPSRAILAEQLSESLDESVSAEIESAWREEVRERLRAYREGKLKAIPGEQVLPELAGPPE